MINQNWLQKPKTTRMQTWNHRNYLYCKVLDASIGQSID